MDYEKAYKEALERARNLHKDAIDMGENIRAKQCEIIFPELKDSKDEKIRKDIITYLKNSTAIINRKMYESWIAWLEKQGEQKTINDTDEEIVEAVKDTSVLDMIEPKFKVGDWVVFNNKHQSIYHVEKIENGYYILRHTHGGTFRVCVLHDESLRLWTIQDAKDGDVLQLGEVTAIFKKYIGNEHCTCYCSFCKAGGFEIPIAKEDNVYGCDNAIPATKEQRNLLFQKMKEAGYEWDTEKKELKKIHVIDESKAEMDYCFTKMMNGEKVSSAWSEEDEQILNHIICDIESIKEEVVYCKTVCDEEIDWLKSLKDRYTWKPSREQLNALNTLNLHGDISYVGQQKQLIELYEQLKKL